MKARVPHPSCRDNEAGAVVLLGAGGKGEHLVGLAYGYGVRYVGAGRCAGIGRHVRHVAFKGGVVGKARIDIVYHVPVN